MRTIEPQSKILLTGATGLIGGELLCYLMEKNHEVWCLIRNKDGKSPKERLNDRVRKSNKILVPNVHIFHGNISENNLGLDTKEYEELIQNIDLIIHCAADTSFINAERNDKTNVEGTKQIIELAQACKNKPFLVYVSTATNGGKSTDVCLKEEDGCKPENDHHNSYTKSKAVSEELVTKSNLDHLIVRPSIVLGDGVQDNFLARQILWFMPLTVNFDAFPLNVSAKLDIIPVSFVVDSLYKLLQKKNREYTCYHISAGYDNALTVGEWKDLTDQYYHRKTPVLAIHPKDWSMKEYKQYVKTDLQRKIFFSLKYYLPFINMNVVFDNKRLNKEIGPLKYPPLTSYLFKVLEQISLDDAFEESLRP